MERKQFADLHIHTTFSDGTYSPEEIIELASKEKILTIAITDHDTTQGLSQDLCSIARRRNILLIPGIELSVSLGKTNTMHLLGLGIDYESESLKQFLTLYHNKRIRHLFALNRDLIKIGLPRIELEEGELTLSALIKGIMKISGISESEIKNRVCTVPSYDKYRNLNLDIEEAIEVIKKANGISFLAHLNLISENIEEIDNLLFILKHIGLEGIEIYHPGYSDLQQKAYSFLSNKYDLYTSGGSDFHGDNRKNVRLGCLKLQNQALSAISKINSR